MSTMKPADPAYAERVRASFDRQHVMTTLGATLTSVAPGEVVISFPFRQEFTQQHGFLHAGIVTTVVDSACGYAALSMAAPETGVLTIEFKSNFLAPAAGSEFRAVGRVIKAGRTIVVSAGEVFAIQDGRERLVVTMQATVMVIRDRASVID